MAQVAQRKQTSGAADLAITYRPVSALIPYARNARTHSEAQIAQIAASIREFGRCERKGSDYRLGDR